MNIIHSGVFSWRRPCNSAFCKLLETVFKPTSTPSFAKCSYKLFLTNLTIFLIIRVRIFRGQTDIGRFAVQANSLYFFGIS